jgi:hypothetical protein
MIDWIQQHGVEFAILNYVYNSAVQALPDIDEHCGKIYQFVYRLAHALAGNWKPATKSAQCDAKTQAS